MSGSKSYRGTALLGAKRRHFCFKSREQRWGAQTSSILQNESDFLAIEIVKRIIVKFAHVRVDLSALYAHRISARLSSRGRFFVFARRLRPASVKRTPSTSAMSAYALAPKGQS
jgi:hypothetical protein